MFNNELLESLKPNIIAVYKVGSSVIPWINNPHDVDYCVYTQCERHHGRLMPLYEARQSGECVFCRPTSSISTPHIYSYIEMFREKVFGEDVEMYNILNDVDNYKKCLIEKGLGYEYTPITKKWYHILTGIYIIENGKYELTDEQIANVQLCHDRQMTQEIYDFIQSKLTEYNNK